jgi:rare lipoprotein A
MEIRSDKIKRIAIIIFILLASMSEAHTVQQGTASWYEIKCNGGTHTASGIPLRNDAMTAAHRTLPMGTKVKVTNLKNKKSVVVKITDRGPYIKGRIIDLTKGAFRRIGNLNDGLFKCKVEVIKD